MKFNFSGSWSNPDKAAHSLIRSLKINVTDESIKQCITEHPDYPSLLSISDCFNEWKISHQPLRVDRMNVPLESLPVPFIAHMLGGGGSFVFVSRITDKTVTYTDEKKENIESSREDFLRLWDGIMLQAEPDAGSGEKDYEKKKREEGNTRLLHYVVALAIPVIAILTIVRLFTQGGDSLFPALYAFLSLLGCIVGVLLLWYDFDQYNPVIQQICSSGKKVNCGAVLQSKDAKIFGISWSAIGFTYFTGNLLFLIFAGIVNPAPLFLLSWLSIVAAAFTVYSVYYQWRVIKQWCLLCLYVQGILVLQLATVLFSGWYTGLTIESIGADLILTALLAFFIPVIVLTLLLPAMRKAKESKRHKTELQRLKHNPQIFEALLEKQNPVTHNPEGLGITLGNPQGRFRIIKVCNPYCGPCAKAHPPIEEILHNNPDVNVRIIFTASGKEGDRLTPPVKHLLAIAEKGDEALTKKALDDWYLADSKDYDAFAAKHPMNGELDRQGHKLEAMRQWCTDMEITGTPTFYVSVNQDNGGQRFYQLPDIYRVNDLNYFFSQ